MNTLEAFWRIRTAAGAGGTVTYADRRLSGLLRLNEEIKAAFEVLDTAGDLPELRAGGKHCPVLQLPNEGDVSFAARAPKTYFEDLAELIERHPQAPPDGFRVFDIADDEQKLPLYLQAAKLAALLNDLAATKDHKRCVLFADNALEIPFLYSEQVLRDIPGLDDICFLMSRSDNPSADAARMLDVYRGLFKQALADVLSPVSPEKRFATLLGNFPDAVFRFRLSFRRFSDEANAAIERYEQTRAGMITALNGVLGNIQTSLIGIPLAGLLALKEMKPSEAWTFENVIIALAVVIVGGLLMALTFSQGKTLHAIKDQYEQLKKEIDESGGGQTTIGNSLTSMASHHSFVTNLLRAVRVIIGVFVAVAIFVLFTR